MGRFISDCISSAEPSFSCSKVKKIVRKDCRQTSLSQISKASLVVICRRYRRLKKRRIGASMGGCERENSRSCFWLRD